IEGKKGEIKVSYRIDGDYVEIRVKDNGKGMSRCMVEKLEIKKGEEVVIVDDEELIHEVWKAKLKEYEKEIRIKFFKEGKEALKYLKSLENKDKVLLLTDYRLKGQEVTGIDIIEEAGMKERHILVTGEEVSRIKDFNKKSTFLKMVPKMYINDIPLRLE
ncbi:hypothetical protein, partial [Candidatus Endomicrobiellum devescovinae]|uniref:hypothetical protein n=1 Tax=Candidatus Endomicrobiellum devescovinae TaxID=3242322 RepID=UPI0028397249|nr:hybrid sensor histidine kinase/response regulator [Endomicrobium sp.]